MKSYGITQSKVINSDEELHLEEFYNLGYTIIPNVLNEVELVRLRAELDRVYSVQEKECGAQSLLAINEENLARMPLAYSDDYAQLTIHAKLIGYVKKILGDFFILHLQNGIINRPNEVHHQSSWHRDLPYQNWTSSEPLACNIFYCLDAFSAQTGGTFLLPFSHQFNAAPSFQYMEKHAIQIHASPGSAVLFNSMLFHRAGYNSSKDQIRRGVNHVYVRPILTQQMNIPEMLQGKYAGHELLSMVLGYKTVPAKNVLMYRTQRAQRKK